MDNVGRYANNSNELAFLTYVILLIKEEVYIVQYFISEENQCSPVIVCLSLKCVDTKLNITQQFLPSSETSLWVISATDVEQSEKQMKAVPQLSEMFSRVKSNSANYTVSNKTLSNMTSSSDYRGYKTSFSTALDALHEITLRNVAECNKSIVTHNLSLMMDYSCEQKYFATERLVTDNNATKVQNCSMNQSILETEPKEFQVFKSYIDPAIYIVILIVGLAGNGILLFMFIRHREIRTRSNSMIINLVVCDIVNLTLSVPLHYYFKYGYDLRYSMTLCRTVFSARHFLRCMSAFAVVALCIQRCNTITSSLHPPCSSTAQRRSMAITMILCIIAVWLLPLAIALPPALVKDFYNWHCLSTGEEDFVQTMVFINVMLYCFILPSVMFFCSMLAARRLKQSARNMPGDLRYGLHEQMRSRSAKVIMALAVVFVLSYFPFHVMILLVRWVHVSERNPLVFYSINTSKHLLFANGCFNPIALFVVSGTFRKLFITLVCRSARQNEDTSKLRASVYTIPTEIELKCVR